MKSANFAYKNTKGQVRIYGTVTLKNDGKVSISLGNTDGTSMNDRYMAKNLANDIVKADFIHEAVISVKQDNKNLVSILKEYTDDLRISYIKECRDYAKKNFHNTVNWVNKINKIGFRTKEWFDFFGIEVELVYPNTDRSFYRVIDRKRFNKVEGQIAQAKKKIELGEEYAILVGGEAALAHYVDSISKLAQRIEKKGMNVDKMTVVRSGIDMNIGILLSDGSVTVKAWTVFACGEINEPHYRYLVK